MNKKIIRLKWDDVIQKGDLIYYPSEKSWGSLDFQIGKTVGSLFLDENMGRFLLFMIKNFDFERNHWLGRFKPTRILDVTN